MQSSPEKLNDTEEYISKLKTKKKNINFGMYKFYNKCKGSRAVKFIHRMLSNVFLRLYLKIFHRIKVEGKHNIYGLKQNGVVVVSNHIHPLDIQMISTFVFGMRPVHWLTLARNFDLSVNFLIKTSGGVPLPENHDDKKRCFEEMNNLLQDGGVLHICPEGSLVSMCDDIRPFKDGAFRFAITNNVPLLPVTLRFDEYNKKGKKYRFPKFIIDVSEPIFPTVPQSAMREKAEIIMKKSCTRSLKA